MGHLMWYSWSNRQAFDLWHNAVCMKLGIPFPGRNAATGEVDENAQWTIAYVSPIVCADDDVRAFIEQHVANLVADNLGVPANPPLASAILQSPVPMPDDGEIYA